MGDVIWGRFEKLPTITSDEYEAAATRLQRVAMTQPDVTARQLETLAGVFRERARTGGQQASGKLRRTKAWPSSSTAAK